MAVESRRLVAAVKLIADVGEEFEVAQLQPRLCAVGEVQRLVVEVGCLGIVVVVDPKLSEELSVEIVGLVGYGQVVVEGEGTLCVADGGLVEVRRCEIGVSVSPVGRCLVLQSDVGSQALVVVQADFQVVAAFHVDRHRGVAARLAIVDEQIGDGRRLVGEVHYGVEHDLLARQDFGVVDGGSVSATVAQVAIASHDVQRVAAVDIVHHRRQFGSRVGVGDLYVDVLRAVNLVQPFQRRGDEVRAARGRRVEAAPLVVEVVVVPAPSHGGREVVFVGDVVCHRSLHAVVDGVLVGAEPVGRIGSRGAVVLGSVVEAVGIEVDVVAREVVAQGFREPQREPRAENEFDFGLDAVPRRELGVASPLVDSYVGLPFEVVVVAVYELACVGACQLALGGEVEFTLAVGQEVRPLCRQLGRALVVVVHFFAAAAQLCVVEESCARLCAEGLVHGEAPIGVWLLVVARHLVFRLVVGFGVGKGACE